MAFDPITLIFPIITAATGAYLISRGMKRESGASEIHGRVRCERPIESPFSRKPVVYFKVVQEIFFGGNMGWKEFESAVALLDFSINGKRIELDHADVRLSGALAYSGYLKHDNLMMERFNKTIRDINSKISIGAVEVPPDAYLSQEAMDGLDRFRKLGIEAFGKMPKQISQKENRPLRISEYSIPVGMELFVVPDPAMHQAGDVVKGSKEYPLLVSDKTEGKALVQEKAFMSKALGVGLIIVAILGFIFLVF
ncbi:MAG: hypothetical protein V1827_04095 [Candidatus Micrarchaeota archaeon]